jgi:uncharacterized protein
MSPAELSSVLRDILEGRPEIRFAALFGSAATRGLVGARDVDIACSFNRAMSWLELGALMGEIEAVVGREVDLVDLDAASTLLRWEVLMKGRLILAPDHAAWFAFRSRATFEWDDLRPYFERESEGWRRALPDTR